MKRHVWTGESSQSRDVGKTLCGIWLNTRDDRLWAEDDGDTAEICAHCARMRPAWLAMIEEGEDG